MMIVMKEVDGMMDEATGAGAEQEAQTHVTPHFTTSPIICLLHHRELTETATATCDRIGSGQEIVATMIHIVPVGEIGPGIDENLEIGILSKIIGGEVAIEISGVNEMTLVIGIEEGEMDLSVLGERRKWKILGNDLTRP